MTKFILAAGVAALAVTAPAASAPGDNRGKDRGAQNQKAERGSMARGQRTERRQAAKARPNVRDQRAGRVQNVRERRANRVQNDRERRADRGQNVREQRAEARGRVADGINARDRRGDAAARVMDRRDRRIVRVSDRRDDRNDRLAQRVAQRDVMRVRDWDDAVRGGIWVNGCPPGLAKKRPIPCVPPGQAKNMVGQPLTVLNDRVQLREMPNRLRLAYADTDDYYYRYGSGYAYRVNRQNNLISALLPLFGLGLTAGQQFPSAYSNYSLPTRLQSFYPSSQNTSYRYANGYVYQVNPMTGLIEDVDPLLGYGYGYGQMMPATYSAYNVPYQYRSFYTDTADQYYRYAPGAIYQVDPTTSLITSVAALLGGGMTVGQRLPVGYSTYNVPMQYRANYYDTPNSWYRYSNGNIYQVNPTTQLVTAIVAAALT